MLSVYYKFILRPNPISLFSLVPFLFFYFLTGGLVITYDPLPDSPADSNSCLPDLNRQGIPSLRYFTMYLQCNLLSSNMSDIVWTPGGVLEPNECNYTITGSTRAACGFQYPTPSATSSATTSSTSSATSSALGSRSSISTSTSTSSSTSSSSNSATSSATSTSSLSMTSTPSSTSSSTTSSTSSSTGSSTGSSTITLSPSSSSTSSSINNNINNNALINGVFSQADRDVGIGSLGAFLGALTLACCIFAGRRKLLPWQWFDDNDVNMTNKGRFITLKRGAEEREEGRGEGDVEEWAPRSGSRFAPVREAVYQGYSGKQSYGTSGTGKGRGDEVLTQPISRTRNQSITRGEGGRGGGGRQVDRNDEEGVRDKGEERGRREVEDDDDGRKWSQPQIAATTITVVRNPVSVNEIQE